MSNTLDGPVEMYDDDGNLITEDSPDQRFARLPRDVVRRLEQEAKAGKETANRLAQLERELAFSKAGVDANHPAAVYFTRAYDGEVTPEAIKEKWAEVAGGSSGAQSQTDAELAQMQQANQLVSGGIADIPTNRLAERDAKLRELIDGQPSLTKDRRFVEILEEYGTTMAP